MHHGHPFAVRMFGGWTYDAKMLESGDWVGKAYADGVPMGGDLPAKPASSAAPKFILQAVKDPDGANLDRIQIIKLSLDGDTYKERLFDVACRATARTMRKPAARRQWATRST